MMTQEQLCEWLNAKLLTQDGFCFEAVGSKRTLFTQVYRGPLLMSLLDPPSYHPPSWKPSTEGSFAEALFQRLTFILTRHQCWWFFANRPQDEYSALCWAQRAGLDNWNIGKLRSFENASAEGGSQVLGLVVGEGQGLLTFLKSNGLEIAYYGSDELWREIDTALSGCSSPAAPTRP